MGEHCRDSNLDTEANNSKRKIREALEIMQRAPMLNTEMAFQQLNIYGMMLTLCQLEDGPTKTKATSKAEVKQKIPRPSEARARAGHWTLKVPKFLTFTMQSPFIAKHLKNVLINTNL